MFHQSGFQFVKAELDTGLTFARIAHGAKGSKKVERNRMNARRAYNSALHFLPSTDEAGMIKGKISALQAALTKLGEVL